MWISDVRFSVFRRVMFLVAALLLVAAPDRAQLCTPEPSKGVKVKGDQHYDRVTMDRFVSTYFSEAFNDAALEWLLPRMQSGSAPRRWPLRQGSTERS
jgi:hypothetical protein